MNCDMVTARYDNDTSKLKNIADVYGLEQLIAEPTRITPTSSTLIDLIYTNCSDKIACSGVCHVGISDHSMVYVYRKLALNGMSNGHNSITYRNFRKFDCQNFRDDIQSQCWNNVYESSDPNEMWQQWKCTFLAIADKHAPLKTMRVRSRSSPWITAELKDLMHNRDILKIKAIKTNDPNDWAVFKKQRNLVNKQVRLAKQVYYQNIFNKHTSDSRKTWQTINELTSRKSGKMSVTSLKVNGLTITNPLELSNEFNNHFANIGPKLASEIDCDSSSYQRYLAGTDKRFELQPTNPNKVFSLLNKRDESKATGLDTVSARFAPLG